MPTLDELGTEYTAFPLHFGGDGGYEIRVIAVENNTAASVPEFSADFNLNAGEYYVIDNVVTWFGFKVFCSKPCMVVQYVRSLPQGGSSDTYMGSFTAVLVPDDRASNSLIFTVPTVLDMDDVTMGAISVIMNTFPVTGLHLNDSSLAELAWQLVENSTNCYATLRVERELYHLYSTEPSER